MPVWALLIPWLRGQREQPADANQCRIAADTIELLAAERTRLRALSEAQDAAIAAQNEVITRLRAGLDKTPDMAARLDGLEALRDE